MWLSNTVKRNLKGIGVPKMLYYTFFNIVFREELKGTPGVMCKFKIRTYWIFNCQC